MWKIDVQKTVSSLGLEQFGAQKWMSSESLYCPECGKKEKIGILLNEKGGGVYHCFKCDAKGSIFNLLSGIGREDLIIKDGERSYSLLSSVDEKLSYKETDNKIDIACQEIEPPIGFRYIEQDDYLSARGWEGWQYESYNVGVSSDPRLKNMLVFLLKERGKVIGYLARSRFSKEWHKTNLMNFKAGKERLRLRYSNSVATEFEKVVGGIDEVVEGRTETVIIVEGIMDKAGVDRTLHLNGSPAVKCCFTCGCKISDFQIEKLKRKGVRKVFLMFDSDAISQTLSAGVRLSKKIATFIIELKGPKDPAEMSYEDFEKVMENPVPADIYRLNKLNICLK